MLYEDYPALVPYLDELARSPKPVKLFKWADYSYTGGAEWTYEDQEVNYDKATSDFMAREGGWPGGWLAVLAHELGHAYADVILNQHFNDATSNAWALDFQNAVGGEPCRLQHQPHQK